MASDAQERKRSDLTEMVSFRLSNVQHLRAKALAADAGFTWVSEWFRDLIHREWVFGAVRDASGGKGGDEK